MDSTCCATGVNMSGHNHPHSAVSKSLYNKITSPFSEYVLIKKLDKFGKWVLGKQGQRSRYKLTITKSRAFQMKAPFKSFKMKVEWSSHLD